MKNMEDGPERQQRIDRMLEILRYDAPWLWGYHPRDYGLYHSWYQNVKPNRISNNNVKYFKIDANLREQKRRDWNRPVLWPMALTVVMLIISFIPAVMMFRRRESITAVSGATSS